MRQNKFIPTIFILFVFYCIAICQHSHADSELGFYIDTKTMAIRKFTEVSSRKHDNPAVKAGLRVGDIVLEVNSIPVANLTEIDNIMKRISPNTVILVKIERKGIGKIYKIKTLKNLAPEVDIVFALLSKGEKISLAVIIGKISNTIVFPHPVNLDEWKSTINSQLQTEFEAVYVQYRNVFDNFSLVDRNRIRKILDELNFQASYYVSNETRLKIGELAGATHLLMVEFSRSPKGRGYADIVSKRLIDIKTGEVLSSVNVNQYYNAYGKLKRIE